MIDQDARTKGETVNLPEGTDRRRGYAYGEWIGARAAILNSPSADSGDLATAVLEAVTPAMTARIKAEALREAATAPRLRLMSPDSDAVQVWLNRRADEIEAQS